MIALQSLLLAPPRPNVVLILADDEGYSDMGCFGSEIRTPNLDALRKRGVAFTQFYNQARCCPTRASLMTGRYPHQVGVGEMIDAYAEAARKRANSPAYRDHLSTESPTMAEALRGAGYRTMMAGKWHLGKRPEEWPVHRGFDRSFVQIDGAMNYYGGDSKNGPRASMALDDKPFVPPHDGFYSTDAFTDRAIEFLDEAKAKGKPFFLYLPYNASHWPLQAPEAEIAKYKGAYDRGWEAIRGDRMAKMEKLGVVPPGSPRAPMDRGGARPWAQLPADRKAEWARRMEVFAAQTTIMDRGIGRVVAELERLGVEKNTLVVFLADNGGAAEDPNSGDPSVPIGDRDSYRGYARSWATVSNTPWRHHKVTAYEGGISTPLIAAWPGGIPAKAEGSFVRTPAHVIDLLPTFLALAGVDAAKVTKPEGMDIEAMLRGAAGPTDRTLFWEHEGNRAIRRGRWKLVALPDTADDAWELYDVVADRVESTNVATANADVARSLKAEYDRWAARNGVMPWATFKARRDEASRPTSAPAGER